MAIKIKLAQTSRRGGWSQEGAWLTESAAYFRGAAPLRFLPLIVKILRGAGFRVNLRSVSRILDPKAVTGFRDHGGAFDGS